MSVKITGLSAMNVRAIRETGIPAVLTATTSAYVGIYGELKGQPDWLVEIVNFFTPEA